MTVTKVAESASVSSALPASTTTTATANANIDLHSKAALIEAVRQGLRAVPKTLPFTFFYDEVGSALFEQICKLPEYYLTRTEDQILRVHAASMIEESGFSQNQDQAEGEAPAIPTMVELGSGSAEKTRRLIAAALERYPDGIRYVPIDVSATAVEESSKTLLKTFPALRIHAFVGDYHASLADIGKRFPGPKWIVFLGSSLGNYETETAEDLLRRLAFVMSEDDRLLLGTDLVKDRATLEAAYDDQQGVTSRFNKNLLARINRELRADFHLGAFDHRAHFNEAAGRVEMHLVSRMDQIVNVPLAGLQVAFRTGESIHTENSHKYTIEQLKRLAEASGFIEQAAWTDPQKAFRVQSWRVGSGKPQYEFKSMVDSTQSAGEIRTCQKTFPVRE